MKIISKTISNKYFIFFNLSLAWYASTFPSITTELSSIEFCALSIHVFSVVIAEILVCVLFAKFYANRPYALFLGLFVYSGFLCINLLGLSLANMNWFMFSHNLTKLFIIIFTFLSLLGVFCLVFKEEKPRIFFGVLSLSFAFFSLGEFLFSEVRSRQLNIPDADDFRSVSFEKKPNVYAISFDSLMPESLFKKHLGEGELGYVALLKREQFRFFKNSFADRVVSIPSLNSFMAIDPNYYDVNHVGRQHPRFFTGEDWSLLPQIFRDNGYKVQTMFSSRYFGPRQGEYVDAHLVPKGEPSVCAFCSHPIYMQFLGFCLFGGWDLGTIIVEKVFQAEFSCKQQEWPDYLSLLLDRVNLAATSTAPWFTFAYIHTPTHADWTYKDTKENRERYKERYLKEEKVATDYLQQIFDIIKEKDPSGIVFVFGDHGPLLSWDKDIYSQPLEEKEKEFYIQDQHGIIFALYPSNACPDYLSEEVLGSFLTPSKFIRRLIQCFGGGEDPLKSDISYAFPYPGKPNPKDFLYE